MRNILDTLNIIALKLREIDNLEDLYRLIVHEGTELSNAKYGSVYAYERKKLTRVYTNLPEAFHVNIRKKGFTMKAFRSKKILLIPITQVARAHSRLDNMEVKSVILIPLIYRKKSIGVISYDTNQVEFTSDQIRSLRLFATMATYSLMQVHHNKQMQDSVELRDLFISVTAHEFRTPLTTVDGYIQLIQKKLKEHKYEDQIQVWVKEMRTEVHRIIELTNELLQISKIKTGKIEYSLTSTQLMPIVQTAITRFSFMFPRHRISITNRSYNDLIIADQDKLLQAISNLLENAGKYSAQHKPIHLIVSNQRNSILVRIKDTGRGISQRNLENIFQGFYKADNSHNTSGIGLGLFISKSIIEAHKGVINVKSELGKGSEFSIRLPVQPKS